MGKLFNKIFIFIGFNPSQLLSNLINIKQYIKDYALLKKQLKLNTDFSDISLFPILHEQKQEAAVIDPHYFHQDLWVAQKIFENKPKTHLDIGSRIDGFVSHLAVFRKVEVFDIRPLAFLHPNILFHQIDITQLPEHWHNYAESISCLHALEHIGLGRYGDTIDAFGYLKAIDNIYHLLKPNGICFISVPIGNQRIEFNAHRVFNFTYLSSVFKQKFTIINFSYINDAGNFIENAVLDLDQINQNFGCYYGCGIFCLRK